MKSCCIQIKKEDIVVEKKTGRVGIVKDFILVPSGINDSTIVCILYVFIKGKTKDKDVMVSSTIEKWKIFDDGLYLEFYPSVHLCDLSDNVK